MYSECRRASKLFLDFSPLQFRPFAECLYQMCECVCKGTMATLLALNQVDLQLLRRHDESWQESSQNGGNLAHELFCGYLSGLWALRVLRTKLQL